MTPDEPTDPGMLAEVKAILAGKGQTVMPGATVTQRSVPKTSHMSIVVLERVRDGETPEYCTHGYAECIRCFTMCWLGHETVKVVSSGEAQPVCIQCAAEQLPPGSRPYAHLKDHLRKDGPHE